MTNEKLIARHAHLARLAKIQELAAREAQAYKRRESLVSDRGPLVALGCAPDAGIVLRSRWA